MPSETRRIGLKSPSNAKEELFRHRSLSPPPHIALKSANHSHFAPPSFETLAAHSTPLPGSTSAKFYNMSPYVPKGSISIRTLDVLEGDQPAYMRKLLPLSDSGHPIKTSTPQRLSYSRVRRSYSLPTSWIRTLASSPLEVIQEEESGTSRHPEVASDSPRSTSSACAEYDFVFYNGSSGFSSNASDSASSSVTEYYDAPADISVLPDPCFDNPSPTPDGFAQRLHELLLPIAQQSRYNLLTNTQNTDRDSRDAPTGLSTVALNHFPGESQLRQNGLFESTTYLDLLNESPPNSTSTASAPSHSSFSRPSRSKSASAFTFSSNAQIRQLELKPEPAPPSLSFKREPTPAFAYKLTTLIRPIELQVISSPSLKRPRDTSPFRASKRTFSSQNCRKETRSE